MKIKVTGQCLELDAPKVISEGARKFLTFEFFSDESWNEFSKTVRFAHLKSGKICDIADVKNGGTYYVPSEVLLGGKVNVGVVGVCDGDKIATTEVKSFRVAQAIDAGKTPDITSDAYATYVNEIKEHRIASKEAERNSAKYLEECRRLEEKAENSSKIALNSKEKAKKLYEEISGMVDAVGMIFHDIRNIEYRLSTIDGNLSKAEMKRESLERAREISEKKREYNELQRREKERERQASDLKRNRGDDARCLADVERDKKLTSIEERVDALENAEPSYTSLVIGKVEGDKKIELADTSACEVDKILVYGQTRIENGQIKGVGEDGFVTFKINDEEINLTVSKPLYSVGSIRDELVLTADGRVNVIRRVAKTTINPHSPFLKDERDGERIMYVTPLTSEAPVCDFCLGASSCFAYGANAEQDSVWVSGEYVFFNLDAKQYPELEDLKTKLEKEELSIIYPKMSETVEEDGKIICPSLSVPFTLSGDEGYAIEYKKDVFKTFEKIASRLKNLEEKEEKNIVEEVYIS